MSLACLTQTTTTGQIGTAVTDASGFYSLSWTPDITGKYTVYASFQGSQSYWPASTETAFTVAPPAPTQAPTASPIANLVNTSELTMYIAAAIIVMVIALAVATLLILQEKTIRQTQEQSSFPFFVFKSILMSMQTWLWLCGICPLAAEPILSFACSKFSSPIHATFARCSYFAPSNLSKSQKAFNVE